jgi:uncharacterized cupin superfamily protein
MSDSWRSAELEKAPLNGRVGHRLVSETDWVISLKPGERLPYHCHVLNYFWTATSTGTTRSHFSDGTAAESSVKTGDTRHYNFAAGERMIHDLENIGATSVSYVTVELKIGSANAPLALA